MIKDHEKFPEQTLDDVISKLRGYDLNMQMKETSADLIQDPSIYHGKRSSAVASTSGGVTAFYYEDNASGDE